MKYRTKLFVLVVALVVVTNGLLAFASHRQCDILLHDEVHRKLRSIAATAAVLLEPDLVAKVRARSDESRPEYGLLRAQLQKIRNANRRKDAWVERIFTLVPAPENNSVVEYGVDSEEQFELVHHATPPSLLSETAPENSSPTWGSPEYRRHLALSIRLGPRFSSALGSRWRWPW